MKKLTHERVAKAEGDWAAVLNLSKGKPVLNDACHFIRQAKDLLARAEQRTGELEQVLGQSAPLVSAEWDRSEDAQGRPVVTLRMSDFSGSVTTVFEPKELESSAHMNKRLNRLWGDLLQVRSDEQLRELQEAISAEDA